MLDVIWGLKTTSMFDAWSFDHFLNGLALGTSVLIFNKEYLGRAIFNLKDNSLSTQYINGLKYRYDLILLLLMSYFWEAVEHYLETGALGKTIEYWLQGVEFWPNRLIADPLLLILGYLVVKKWPRLVWPARTICFVWLFVHIFIFPHSMYLHEIF